MRFNSSSSMIIIRISEVKMQKTEKTSKANRATSAHRKVQASTTLNRKYVKKPTKKIASEIVNVRRSPAIKKFNSSIEPKKVEKTELPKEIPTVEKHPIQMTAINRMQKRTNNAKMKKMTAKEMKDQAIQKALTDAEKISKETKKTKKMPKFHFSLGKVVLALSCAAVAVFAIVYFVNLNMPDISMRVAAMQTGIDATYPSYVPRGFSLSDITSEENKIVLNFINTENNDAFSLVEEKSSWDSNALLSNFVKDEYGENYSVIREQGLTIYINNSDATWVNGGVVYKIETTSGSLTKKQISAIATSL